MEKTKQRSAEADPRNEQGKKPRKRREKSGEIMILTYFFLLIFVLLIGYLVYFQFTYGESMANSPYNRKRQNQLAQKVVRGQILSNDGEVLAKTETDDEGNEVRVYPYGRTFAHVVGYSINGGSGLEAGYNIRLLKSHASIFKRVRNLTSGQKNIGDNLVTTLDTNLQAQRWS